MIDHEAEHVILIQGKAFPDGKFQTNSEPLVAPVEIPKYVLRLRFDFRSLPLLPPLSSFSLPLPLSLLPLLHLSSFLFYFSASSHSCIVCFCPSQSSYFPIFALFLLPSLYSFFHFPPTFIFLVSLALLASSSSSSSSLAIRSGIRCCSWCRRRVGGRSPIWVRNISASPWRRKMTRWTKT